MEISGTQEHNSHWRVEMADTLPFNLHRTMSLLSDHITLLSDVTKRPTEDSLGI